MKKLTVKFVTSLLALVMLLQPISTLAMYADGGTAQKPAVFARWLLEPKGATRVIAGNRNPTANEDGSRNLTAADDFGVRGLWAALPSGTYNIKFRMKITRGNQGDIREGDRPMFIATPGGDIETPSLSTFPNGEWKQVSMRFVVPQNRNNVMSEYAFKGPMNFVIGNNGTCQIGREIVIASNSDPLINREVELAYIAGNGGNATVLGQQKDDFSVTAGESGDLLKFDGKLSAGTHYVKFSTKITAKGTENLDKPVAKLVDEEGRTYNLDTVGSYSNGEWKNNVVRIDTDGKNHTYTLTSMQNGGADNFCVAQNFEISSNSTEFENYLVTTPDTAFVASNFANRIASGTNNIGLFDRETDAYELKINSANGPVMSAMKVRVASDEIVNSGFIPRGKFYVKVLAKVPALATSGTQNSLVFAIEKDAAIAARKQTENITLGEFTEANKYQTIVREFDAADTANNQDVTMQINYMGGNDGVSDMSISKVVISKNDDPIDGANVVVPEILWPSDQLLPSFPTPANNLTLINLASNASDNQIVAARAVQGLVNRTRPRITVLESMEGGSLDTYAWTNTFGLNYTEIAGANGSAKLKNLINMYKDEISGYVLYDNNQVNAQSLNVATTVAGIKNGIMLEKSMEQEFGIALGLTKLEDFTDRGWGRESGRVAAADFLRNNYGKASGKPPEERYNDRLTFNVSPGNEKGSESDFGVHTRMRDMAVALKAPCFWLGGREPDIVVWGNVITERMIPAEKAAVERFYDDMNAVYPNSSTSSIGGVCLGFFPDESYGIETASPKGIIHVPSDNFGDYTITSALPRELDPPSVPKKPELKNKNYVSIVSSDGDNICTQFGPTRKGDMYDDRNRGEAVVGWTMSPALLDAAPQALQYYYSVAKDGDSFPAGPSGLGYTTAQTWSNANSNAFARAHGYWANKYFEKTGINTITLWNTISTNNRAAFRQNFPELLGFYLQGGNGAIATGSDVPSKAFEQNAAYIMDKNAWRGTWTDTISNLNQNPTSPQFRAYQGQTFPIRMPELFDMQTTVKANNPSVEFVRSDHYFMLIAEQNNLPINTALQARTFASSSAKDFNSSKAVDGSFGRTHGWQSSADDTNPWIVIDREKRLPISNYVMKNAETAYYPADRNTKDFEIEGSNDKETWTNLDEVKGNTKGIVREDISDTGEYRYIRIKITNAGADGIARIQDFEIYSINKGKGATVKTELQAQIADYQDVEKGNYSYDGWELFQNAKNAATTVVADASSTQVRVDEAREELILAFGMLSPLNTAAATTEINDANDVLAVQDADTRYSTASWSTFMTAYTAATNLQEEIASGTLSQFKIDKVVNDLKKAIENLSSDVTELQEVISSAPTASANYSENSWTAYTAVLATANAKANATDAPQYEYDQAMSALETAISNLIDISPLKQAVATAKATDTTSCTEETIKALSDAIEAGEQGLSNGGITSAQVAEFTTDINRAVEGLVRVVQQVKVNKITLSGVTKLTIGQAKTLKNVVAPSDASERGVRFKSSNSKIVVVASNGKVTAKGVGAATITATAVDGSGVSGKITITVKPKKPAISKVKKASKTSVKITYKKDKAVTNYEIWMRTNKGKFKKLKDIKKTSFVKKKLARKKTYSFKIRTYKKVAKKKHYSAFSKVKKVKL